MKGFLPIKIVSGNSFQLNCKTTAELQKLIEELYFTSTKFNICKTFTLTEDVYSIELLPTDTQGQSGIGSYDVTAYYNGAKVDCQTNIPFIVECKANEVGCKNGY